MASSTNVPSRKSLHIVSAEPARSRKLRWPEWRRRRKARLSVVRNGQPAPSRRIWTGNIILGLGVLTLAIVVASAAVAATHASSPSGVTTHPAGLSRLHVRTAFRELLPAIRDTQAGLSQLDKGNIAGARAHLARAVPAAVQARADIGAGPVAGSSTRLLERGIDKYVVAVTRTRDALDRGNILAAIQSSLAVADAESDVILAMGAGSSGRTVDWSQLQTQLQAAS